ncbi:hypothetical protein OPT61_g2864 [Boeremia exigua]|uniref:Uncharacterized protein n=1 Tax=Boeremia exigua TaxID=749465 RepID=A0ACC2IK71_9PLEO|nr:hypothetical protein OPT61_g2864 [Boeremia exigua]
MHARASKDERYLPYVAGVKSAKPVHDKAESDVAWINASSRDEMGLVPTHGPRSLCPVPLTATVHIKISSRSFWVAVLTVSTPAYSLDKSSVNSPPPPDFAAETMAESIEEFFTDDRLTNNNLRDSAVYIQSYLKRKASIQSTIQSIIATVSNASLSELLDECIVRAAEQLPETHAALVELVMQLRSQQQQHSSDQCATDLDNALVISLGQRWTDYGDPNPQDAWKEQARAEWTNLNHFSALLFLAGIERLSSFGKQTLQMTLKRGSWRVNWEGQENTSDSIVALEGHAVAAAHWIVVSGSQLYNQCNDVQREFTTLQTNLNWILEQDGLNEGIKTQLQEAKTIMDTILA